MKRARTAVILAVIASAQAAVEVDGRALLQATGTVFDSRKTGFSFSLGEGVFSFAGVRVWDAGTKP